MLCAAPFLRVQPSRADVRALPPESEPARVAALLDRDFPSAARAPLSIVFELDGDVLDGDRPGRLWDYTARLETMPDVARVESVLSFAGAHDRADAIRLAPRLEVAAEALTHRLGAGALVRDRRAL